MSRGITTVNVQISINGQEYGLHNRSTDKGEYDSQTVSLSIDRANGDAVNNFTLELYDQTALMVEQNIVTAKDKLISVRYCNVPEAGKDAWIKFDGYIWDFETTFSGLSVMLSITGTVGVAPQIALGQMTINWVAEDDELYDDNGMIQPHKIFERIVGEFLGVKKIETVETKPVKIDSWNQESQTIPQFINEKLCKNAVSNKVSYDKYGNLVQSGTAGYQFTVTGDTWCFKPMSYTASGANSKYIIQFGTSDPTVISFTGKLTGAAAMSGVAYSGSGKIAGGADYMDGITGDELTEESLKVDEKTDSASGDNTTDLTLYKELKVSKDLANKLNLKAGENLQSQIKAQGGILKTSSAGALITDGETGKPIDATTAQQRLANMVYQAELKVWSFSDNAPSPGDYINVVIRIPNSEGLTTESRKHHFSGLYYIITSNDSITSAGLISTYKLVKNLTDTTGTLTVDGLQSSTGKDSDDNAKVLNGSNRTKSEEKLIISLADKIMDITTSGEEPNSRLEKINKILQPYESKGIEADVLKRVSELEGKSMQDYINNKFS